MTISFDSFNTSAGGNTPRSVAVVTVGVPRGVIGLETHDGTADDVTTMTVEGIAMTEVTGSPNIHATGEGEVVYGYFLGASITDDGTINIATTGGSTGNKLLYGIVLAAAADTEIVDVDATINSDSQADPSITLSLGGRTCFCVIAGASGQNAVGGVAPLTGWGTTINNETDTGTEVAFCYSYDTIGSADVTAGWTQAAEDACAIAIAVAEVAAAGATRGMPFGQRGTAFNGGRTFNGIIQ